jgi:GDP/UDP-N,N'-diacetylbacillosamine 2-epimerase (hydrolysing)
MKLCTITGSRAEFFLLKNLITKLTYDKKIKNDLLVTGSHNSAFFGNTIKDIRKSNFRIKAQIDLKIKKDKPSDISNYFSEGVKKFSYYLNKIKPDLILILGDRYEIFSAAIAAHILRIPIAHIYGGETTQGAIDEGIRHSITKLSHIHFVSTNKYFSRVKQLGENPKMIFNVGSLGVEALKKNKTISKKNLEKKLGIKFRKKNILITFHSETIHGEKKNVKNLKIFLDSLKNLKDTSLIFTAPGADFYYKSIFKEIKKFVKKIPQAYFFKSLGHENYFSLCKKVDLMIGNSSSGIIEMPSFKKWSINIGVRQEGRVRAKSIIDIKFKKSEIEKLILKLLFTKNTSFLKNTKNPYDNGNSSDKIIKILKKIKLPNIYNKKFYDYI